MSGEDREPPGHGILLPQRTVVLKSSPLCPALPASPVGPAAHTRFVDSSQPVAGQETLRAFLAMGPGRPCHPGMVTSARGVGPSEQPCAVQVGADGGGSLGGLLRSLSDLSWEMGDTMGPFPGQRGCPHISSCHICSHPDWRL